MYRLVGRLEASELSELYRAERDDGLPVVIKLFHPKTTDLAYARVIADTSQRLGAIAGSGLARVLQIGLFQRRLAIVREGHGRYTLGQALTRLNTREVVLPPAVALSFVIELAGTLEAAHRADVVHGAITPGNVLLGADGASHLSDFGALAALMASPALKRAFGTRGRSSYRAPELRTAQDATVASDVYALGALTYELLTLKEPSIGRDSLSTRQAEKLPPPSRLVRRLNARVDPVVMRALDPSPGRRQRSALELQEALREFLSAQGGVPGRDDVRGFVDELFPKDVVVNALGPVPFEGAFELDDIAGVSDLVADSSLDEAPDARQPFSGGAVDERTSTSDGLPVFDERAPTQQEVPAVVRSTETPAAAPGPVTWDAPAGIVAGAKTESSKEAEVARRVRAIEDFEPRAEAPGDEAPARATQGPTPKADSARQKLKTLVTFAVPFKRAGDYVPPDWKKAREDRRRAQVQAVRMGAAILTLFTMGIVGLWLLKSPDPIGDLISWLPEPIEVPLAKLRKPSIGPPGPPLALPSNVKLPDFDTPAKGRPTPRPPEPEPPKKVELPRPAKTAPPPPPKADCYVPPPHGGHAFLSVTLARAGRVELDGVRVCGPVNRLPVSPGKHVLKVVDQKTKQEWKSTVRLEAGKHQKIEPGFR